MKIRVVFSGDKDRELCTIDNESDMLCVHYNGAFVKGKIGDIFTAIINGHLHKKDIPLEINWDNYVISEEDGQAVVDKLRAQGDIK